MTTFQWRAIEPNTLRAYNVAAKDYETVTGIRVDRADAVSIASWRASMEGRGLAINTIRSRLSAVSVVSGVKVELPKRKCVPSSEQVIMSEDQVCVILRSVQKDTDRALLISVLLIGKRPTTFAAHFAGMTHSNGLTTQEITRKIKRYARLAGLNRDEVNMRTLVRSGKALLKKYDAQTLVERVLPKPAQKTVAWQPLHGIGRRSQRIKA